MTGTNGTQTNTDLLESVLDWTVELANATAPDLAIPTCGDWTATDLWQHLGTVHRWAAAVVEERPDRLDRSSLAVDLPAENLWSPWLADGADTLLGVLRDAPVEDEVWTWGDDHRVGWWTRRQIHETLIHNIDAALALGEGIDLDPGLASDCLDELLDNTNARRRGADGGDSPATIHLHATDDTLGPDGEWLISISGNAITYMHEHAKGDAAVRGPMTGLLLATYRRLDLEEAGAEIFGDRRAWDRLLDLLSLD